MNDFFEKFFTPPVEYGTAPLWVWNDQMNEEQIRFQLNELKTHGFGGAFVHPRPGLITEYLSDEWFRLWRYALKIAGKLGLKLYIYDENSYPSGFAGGHVSSQLPDCLAVSAVYHIIPKGKTIDQKKGRWLVDNALIKAFTCKQKSAKITILEDITEKPAAEWQTDYDIFIINNTGIKTSSWLADMAYVDLLKPEVTRLFLETTYEKYYEHFGCDFGSTIPAIFTDEPGLFGSAIYDNENRSTVPYSSFLAEEFRRRRGYSLKDHLPCIFIDAESDLFEKPDHKVRFDFYTTVRELWTENFIKPISIWCADHGIAFTGHFMEHVWPLACGSVMSPSIMQNYVYQQWPGVDYLLSTPLKNRPDDMLLVTLLELRSVVNQFGKKRALCEAFGAGGWDSDFVDYKRIADHLMVNGINVLNEHLTYGTIAGARKRDHPQSFDWRQSWWDEYTELNGYFSRVCFALAQGFSRQRILLIHPTTTGYLIPRNREHGDIMRDKLPEAPDMKEYLELIQKLSDNQWDFDLGDEGILEEYAKVEQNQLVVKLQHYDVIILSADMKNINAATIKLLTDFLKSDGTVFSLGKPGGYTDGDIDKEGKTERLVTHPQSHIFNTYAELDASLRNILPSRIKANVNFPTGVSHMRRELADGNTLYFFVNHAKQDSFMATLTLEGCSVTRLDCWKGNTSVITGQTHSGNTVTFPLSLQKNESTLLLVSHDLPESVPETKIENKTEVLTNFVNAKAEKENVLTLDYCDLELDGKEYRNMNAFEAGTLVYRSRGFDHNPWDNSVQYKNRIISRNNYGAGSGFTVRYRFVLEAGVKLDHLLLAVERAYYYTLQVNGVSIQWRKNFHWLDHHIETTDILSAVRSGENEITLTAPVFDVLLELESVYLLGNFNLTDNQGRWALTAYSEVQKGNWVKQGFPFYAGSFIYEYEFEAIKKANYFVECSDWQGVACSVLLNGKRLGLLNGDGKKPLSLTGCQPGKNRISLRVCGSMKNLLGPHHNPDKPRGSAWPQLWRSAPRFRHPVAGEYDFISQGLLGDIAIFYM